MKPRTEQLLRVLHGNAAMLRMQNPPGLDATALAGMEAALAELSLRSDTEYFRRRYHDALALIRQGLELLAGPQAALSLAEAGNAASAFLSTHPPALPPGAPAAEYCARAAELLTTILTALATAGRDAGEAYRDYAERVIDWEVDLYRRRLENPAAETNPGPLAIDPAALQRYLSEKLPAMAPLTVRRLEKLGGGFSKITLRAELEDKAGTPCAVVLRAEASTGPLLPHTNSLADEYSAIRLAHDAGIQVPEPLCLELDTAALGARFLVSEAAAGRTFGSALGGQQAPSRTCLRDIVSVLARIHAISLRADDPRLCGSRFAEALTPPGLPAATARNVARWARIAREAEIADSPLIARSLAWLARNVPESAEPAALVHCDYGLHNLLLTDEGVAAVLDWEVAQIGDPALDIISLHTTIGGFIGLDQLLQWYEEAGGRPITPFRLHYADVFYCMLATVVCNAALKQFEKPGPPDENLLTLGLRFAHHNASRINAAIRGAEAALLRQLPGTPP